MSDNPSCQIDSLTTMVVSMDEPEKYTEPHETAYELGQQAAANLDDPLAGGILIMEYLTGYTGSARPSEENLHALVRLRSVVDGYIEQDIAKMREDGASWTDVGNGLGVSRQAALKRYSK